MLYSFPNNYQYFLIGSKLSGMGGIGTGCGEEAASIFYNPANAIYSKNNEISVTVSTYGLYQISETDRIMISDYLNPSVSYSSPILIVPNSTAYQLILDADNPSPKYFLTIGIFAPMKCDHEGKKNNTDGYFIN